MTYLEYTEQSTVLVELQMLYPSFFWILDNKFFAFEVLYPLTSLDRLIKSFIDENKNEFTKVMELENQLLEAFKKENYGSSTNMNVTSTPDETSTTILSYDGFNTEGDFNKTVAKHEGNSTNTTNQLSVNNLEIFISLNQTQLQGMYKGLVKDFGNKFLRVCYN